MGTTVMKEAPDVDYYIVWSSVTESPYFGGNREETLAFLWDLDDRKPDRIHPDLASHPENRLKRTDESGSSCMVKHAGYPADGAWEDVDGMVYEQKGVVKRSDLFVLTRRLGDDEAADLSDLIEPFEDDDSQQTAVQS